MSSKIPRPHIPQKVQRIKIFFEPHIIDDLTSILNKIVEPIINPAIRQKWINYSNSLLSKNTLGYASQDEYLETTSLSKEDIVENTIIHVFPDMSTLDIKYLTKKFMIFTKKAHILIYHFKEENIPMYREIYYSLIYIKRISKIIKKNNKVRSSSHLGIKQSSNWKALLRSEIDALKYRLNHPYFAITNKEEIEKTNLQIYYMEKAINEEYKILVDLFHFANIYFGLDYPLLNMTPKDQNTISQLLNLLNGFKTSDEEFIASSMIFLREQSGITNKDDYGELSKSILNISIQFFTKIYLKNTKKRKTRTNHFTYNKDYVDKQIRVKTFIDDMPIYTYSKQNYFNFMKEMFDLFYKSFKGECNIFEPDLPNKNKTSDFTVLKNLATIKKDFNFTKREIVSFFTISDIINQDNEQISNLLIG